MNFISQYIDFILHLNVHLQSLFITYGVWVYGLLFLIIFFETGIFLTPFLPGESLLFATGTLAAASGLNIHGLALTLMVAAILGGFVNYAMGVLLGTYISYFQKKTLFSNYLKQTHDFYEKHGTVAVVIARLIPIIRTYAPFVAGIARMNFFLFTIYNVIGGILWVGLFIYVSYFFGNVPVIKQHFSLIIVAIIFISIIPVVMEVSKHLLKSKSS